MAASSRKLKDGRVASARVTTGYPAGFKPSARSAVVATSTRASLEAKSKAKSRAAMKKAAPVVGDMNAALRNMAAGDFKSDKSKAAKNLTKKDVAEARHVRDALTPSGMARVAGYTYMRRGRLIRVRPHMRAVK